MVTTDTLEGTINRKLSYHYDVAADVLYLRVVGQSETPALGEENDEGLIELRDERTGKLVGVTVVGWWKRFGDSGSLPDSIREFLKPGGAVGGEAGGVATHLRSQHPLTAALAPGKRVTAVVRQRS